MNVVGERLAFLLRIREIPGSNFSPEISYSDFPQSVQAHAGIKLGHGLFHPKSFPIHHSRISLSFDAMYIL
jgi:hypothetical protein